MSHVMKEVYNDCDLHKALMNVGYAIHRKNYYVDGMYTGKVVDYYAPAIDFSSQMRESPAATLHRLRELDKRLGTDFVGDLARDLRGFGGDHLYRYFYGA